MGEFTVAHVITETVDANSAEEAREKSEHYVRQKIEDDAGNDGLSWEGSSGVKPKDS